MIVDDTGWEMVAAIAAVASVLGASAMAIVRAAATRDFARIRDLEEIEAGVQLLREQMAGVPTHADLGRIFERLAQVEANVSGLRVGVDGVGDSVRRVEHAVDLLYQHQLSGGRRELS